MGQYRGVCALKLQRRSQDQTLEALLGSRPCLTVSAMSRLRAALGHRPVTGAGACPLFPGLLGEWVSQFSWGPSLYHIPYEAHERVVNAAHSGGLPESKIPGPEACKGTLMFRKLSRIIKYQIIFHTLHSCKPFT